MSIQFTEGSSVGGADDFRSYISVADNPDE